MNQWILKTSFSSIFYYTYLIIEIKFNSVFPAGISISSLIQLLLLPLWYLTDSADLCMNIWILITANQI